MSNGLSTIWFFYKLFQNSFPIFSLLLHHFWFKQKIEQRYSINDQCIPFSTWYRTWWPILCGHFASIKLTFYTFLFLFSFHVIPTTKLNITMTHHINVIFSFVTLSTTKSSMKWICSFTFVILKLFLWFSTIFIHYFRHRVKLKRKLFNVILVDWMWIKGGIEIDSKSFLIF